ncbi:MAG: methyltransferase domain-containing protein, partial [Thermoplasmata archaeon]|nr:methyltransferase domain-containing protein [Thermoplasmata archaeon]
MKKGKAPLGQNFLTDGYYKNKVLKMIDVKEGESVVEVGAGEGQITEGLLRKGAVVTAIELDPRLAASLREKFGGKVKVIVGDVLKMDFLTP